MNTFNKIKSAISYFFAFFAGVYGLCLFDGEINFFTIFGFLCCVLIAVVASPVCRRFFKPENRGK